MRELSTSMSCPDGAQGAGAAAAQTIPAPAGRSLRLGAARRGAKGVVAGIAPPAARAADAIDAEELERRLLEMGFVEGARFEVLHEGPVGRDPIAVKIDDTRVALRRRDANALIIELDKDAFAV